MAYAYSYSELYSTTDKERSESQRDEVISLRSETQYKSNKFPPQSFTSEIILHAKL